MRVEGGARGAGTAGMGTTGVGSALGMALGGPWPATQVWCHAIAEGLP